MIQYLLDLALEVPLTPKQEKVCDYVIASLLGMTVPVFALGALVGDEIAERTAKYRRPEDPEISFFGPADNSVVGTALVDLSRALPATREAVEGYLRRTYGPAGLRPPVP